MGAFSELSFEIDDEDWRRICNFKFYGNKTSTDKIRVLCYGNGKLFYLSRFLLCAKRGNIVDHKDRNMLNNKKDNLVFSSFLLNNNNIDRLGKGVSKKMYRNGSVSWQVRISYGGQRIQIGSFPTEQKAIEEYVWALNFYYKEVE